MSALVALLLALVQDPPAWKETRFHRIHLRNGNFIDGTLVRNEPEAVALRIKTGEIEVGRDLIVKVEYVMIRSLEEKPVVVEIPLPPPVVEEAPAVATSTTAPAAGPVQRRAEELIVRARHIPAEQKEDVVRELVALGADGALALVSLLEKLNDDDLRFAGRVLREIRSPVLKDPLRARLSSPSPLLRAEAVATLAALGVESDRLTDASPAVRVAALEAAAILKTRAAFERAVAMGVDPHPEVRRQAVRTAFLLAREFELGQPLAEGLARVLGSAREAGARVEILDALGRLRNAEVWSAAAEELRSEDAEVRAAAARCLGELRHPDASPAMADAMGEETAVEVKIALAEAAGKLKDPALVSSLIARLTDPSPKVVRACGDALYHITGQNHGTNKARWEAYWARVEGR